MAEILKGKTAKEYIEVIRTLSRIKEHIQKSMVISVNERNKAMDSNNALNMSYHQGTLDVLLDLMNILEGHELTAATTDKKEL